jgi:hypothetical protein
MSGILDRPPGQVPGDDEHADGDAGPAEREEDDGAADCGPGSQHIQVRSLAACAVHPTTRQISMTTTMMANHVRYLRETARKPLIRGHLHPGRRSCSHDTVTDPGLQT